MNANMRIFFLLRIYWTLNFILMWLQIQLNVDTAPNIFLNVSIYSDIRCIADGLLLQVNLYL